MNNKAWLISKDKEEHQKVIDDLIEKINKDIEKDNVWKGRFYVEQINSNWSKNDANLWVSLKFNDRNSLTTHIATGTVNEWKCFNGFKLKKEMNNFIVNKVKTKREKEYYRKG